MAKRTYFVVQIGHLQAVLPLLTMEERGELLTALAEHASDEKMQRPTHDPKVSMAFNIMAGDIDENWRKYDATVEKRRAAANSRYAQKADANASICMQEDTKADITKTKTKTKTKTTVLKDCLDSLVAVSPDNGEETAPKTGPTANEVSTVKEAWNSLGLSQVTTVTASTNRGKMLAARLREYGLDKVLAAVEQIRQSSFLRGQSTTGWIVTFDWFVKPNNFLKVLEGNYNDHAEAQKARSFLPDDWASGLEAKP